MPLPELASGKLSEISDETGVLCLFKLFANRQSDGNREWDARKNMLILAGAYHCCFPGIRGRPRKLVKGLFTPMIDKK